MFENNIINHVISLQSFTVFSEYFIALSIIYILIVLSLISYNNSQLMLQKALSDSIALILFMACYLIINDDLIVQAQECFVFDQSIINDYFGFFSKLLICFFSAIYFLFISDFLKDQKLTSFEYLIIILFAVLGLMLMCSSNDLLIAYLTIELSSLAFYILASFKKTSSYSIEAGIKYFITGSVSSAFFLLGSSFIYGITGSINFYDFLILFRCSHLDIVPHKLIFTTWQEVEIVFWYALQLINKRAQVPLDFSLAEIGLTFILFSLFIKLALAPFHLWSLDVYEGSPTSSTFFFAVISKLSIFILLIRICYIGFLDLNEQWNLYFLWIGVFSIFVGSFGGLKQKKLKTLLAYSSTSHMGYLLLTLSTNLYLGIEMVLFYMVVYMITGLCVWYIILFLKLKPKTPTLKYNKELGDLSLLHKSNKSVAFLLSLTMFSIAGIPPLVGFLAKLNIFIPLIFKSLTKIALLSILFSVISTFYYIRIIKVLYFENLLVGKLYFSINSEKTVILSLLVFLLIFLFVNPNLLYLFCYKITLLLPYILIETVLDTF